MDTLRKAKAIICGGTWNYDRYMNTVSKRIGAPFDQLDYIGQLPVVCVVTAPIAVVGIVGCMVGVIGLAYLDSYVNKNQSDNGM